MGLFSRREIQNAADNVSRAGFGDFMFQDPGSRMRSRRRCCNLFGGRNTSRRRTTCRRTVQPVSTRRCSTRRSTKRSLCRSSRLSPLSTRRSTRCSCRSTRRSTCCSGRATRRNTRRSSGNRNHLQRSFWRDGNMWKLRVNLK